MLTRQRIKKLLHHTVLAAMLLLAAKAGAQPLKESLREDTARPNAIKINPVSIILGTYGLAGELSLNKILSVQLGAAYIERAAIDGVNVGDLGIGMKGFQITPELRAYILNNRGGATGPYIGIMTRFYHMSSDSFSLAIWGPGPRPQPVNLTQQVDLSTLQGGFIAGYQYKLKTGLSFDLNMGPYRQIFMDRKNRLDPALLNQGDWLTGDDIQESVYGVRVGFRVSGGVGYSF